VPVLRRAVADLSYLLSGGYAEAAALKLVGDHYQLHARQRRAVLGAACSDASLAQRRDRQIPCDRLTRGSLVIDGYNLLITTESILSGGVLLCGRDGCIRDLASVHGSYRKVEETRQAIQVLGETLTVLRLSQVRWVFDAPVSNSGRLRDLMTEAAQRQGWPWEVRIERNVDRQLAETPEIVVTSDGWILNRVAQWANVADAIIHRLHLEDRVTDLATPIEPS
jgi:hypothetical protein